MTSALKPRIAIPVPHSGDPAYAERVLPQYEQAVAMAGGEPVRIPLNESPEQVMKRIERCDGVLLPGSRADVDPAKYSAVRDPQTADADMRRDTVDELLLQDAYNMRKPILGICYGAQILNVYRSGTLVQDIHSLVNHESGRKVEVAHQAKIEPGTLLAGMVGAAEIPVNSSHHQAAERVGDGLRVAAVSPADGVIEAVEGTTPGHWVLGVQWHPERSVELDEPSRAIFRGLVEAARARGRELVQEFESVR